MIPNRRRIAGLPAAALAVLCASCSGGRAEPYVITPSASAAQEAALVCALRMPGEADRAVRAGAVTVRSVETREARAALYRALESALRDSTTVHLDLRLSDHQLAGLPLREDMLYVDLDADPDPTQGAELLVDLSAGCEHLGVDRRPGHGALAGYFRVREITGPRMGTMSVVVVPVEPRDHHAGGRSSRPR